MGREFLTIIIPLLLPTGLYVAWRLWLGRTLQWPASWMWLLTAGLTLAALTLVLVSLDFGGPRNGVYVPPHLSEDGTVVPGHVEPTPSR
jgi:hypothetical protein